MTDFVFIDSGIGGIPYMTSLLRREPDARCVYVADSKNFPYGTKTHQQVVDCVKPLVQKVCQNFVPSVIILACNTISVNALEELRREFPNQKFVGTVPAIKLASGVSKKRCIGLIATAATCENPYNLELKEKFAKDCKLVCRADGKLVSFIEEKGLTATETELEAAVRPAIDFFSSKGCDVIILGCTHFLNIKDVFEKVALQFTVPEPVEGQGPQIHIVDSVDGVVRHALDVLHNGVLGAEPLGEGVREDRQAGWTQGETYPSLFITGQLDENTGLQYAALCKKYGIKFEGLLK